MRICSGSRGRNAMSQAVAWIALLLAGLLDVAWASSVRLSDGYTRLGWSAVSLLLLASFVYLLGRATQVIPLGTAYAVWAGVGAIGTIITGAVFFGEALTLLRLLGLAFVVGGIVLLKVA